MLRGGAWLSIAAMACAAELPPPPRFTPSAMPGASITHSRECACRRCSPARCCGGDEDPPSAALECRAASLGEGELDFSGPGACGGIAVQSCAGSCQRVTWRALPGPRCQERRPQDCCAAAP